MIYLVEMNVKFTTNIYKRDSQASKTSGQALWLKIEMVLGNSPAAEIAVTM